MKQQDWKDRLGALSEILPDGPEPIENQEVRTKPNVQQLVIRYEKRNGKPTTIVSRFAGTNAALLELAGQLKKLCSAGGSAKDDEILIQGDVRKKVAVYLRSLGHVVKGDV